MRSKTFVRSYLLATTLVLLSLPVVVIAQERNPYRNSDAIKAIAAEQNRLFAACAAKIGKARDFLRVGKFDQAEAAANEALDLVAEIPGGGMQVHDFLAELYFAKGAYAVALAESLKGSNEMDPRVSTTKALSLIGLGRLTEAGNLLDKILLSDDARGCILGDLSDLPIKSVRSPKTLWATAFLVRAAMNEGVEADPTLVRLDYESASRLAASNPALCLNYGHFCRATLHRKDLALPLYVIGHNGSKATRDEAKAEIARMSSDKD